MRELTPSEERIKDKACDAAKNNFKSGLNCAESVYMALIEVGLVDFPSETVAMTTAFGGGIGLTGGVCGALAGMVMGVSAVHGRFEPLNKNQQDNIKELYGNPGRYRFFNQIPHKFKQEFGSTQCDELNKDYSEWADKERMRNCMKIVLASTEMAVEFIYLGNKEGYTQPFGDNMAGKA
ncbi:hypothetical protein SYNTR_0324 [Candidatus Syntrophocurvum alkaliphilum]|uniref:C_GCAxxG_C_C family protein n=1 Tax=Candidatus Syntrophocurvum alkaliphilum TaxID=2293317 RepID=A0A6I6D8R8_9FIRM|nr:C-GCAxxG-C-C family protein [Candidatus Syntrophocurvum alkaliphilum]QGT98917.1 hypothetical protein SYNTR_0324 [Candidatus Syntrophocurvum alkaliphilum]